MMMIQELNAHNISNSKLKLFIGTKINKNLKRRLTQAQALINNKNCFYGKCKIKV